VARILAALAVQSIKFGINGKRPIPKDQFLKMYENLFFIDYEHNAELGCKHEMITCIDDPNPRPSFDRQMKLATERCQTEPNWQLKNGIPDAPPHPIQDPLMCMMSFDCSFKYDAEAGIH